MKSIDELLEKTKGGRLTEEELVHVVQRIKKATPRNDADLYTLIYILGKAANSQYKELVESFLYYPSNPMISKIALETLCDFWDLTDSYLSDLKMFVKGTKWDQNKDIQLIAIGIAGRFLKKTHNKDLMLLLVDLFQNQNENELTRECAHEAIAQAVGKC